MIQETKELTGRYTECALLRVHLESEPLGSLENLALILQLANQIMIDVIHGTLVCGTGILQPKGHDHVFEQSHGTEYSECSLVYVLRSHKNLIVAGVAIHETQNLVAGSRIDQRFHNGHQVFILRCGPVEVPKIHVDSPPAILLLYRYNAIYPLGIPARPDEPYLQHLLYLFLNLFQDFGPHLMRSLLKWPKSFLEREPMFDDASVQSRHLHAITGKTIRVLLQ
jgi:hypothetical protein